VLHFDEVLYFKECPDLKDLFEKPASIGTVTDPSFETSVFKNARERDIIRSAVENMAIQLTSSGYDAVVLLDRGGRIFGHLLKEYWRNDGAPRSELPELLFMNFGREKLEYSSQGAFVSREKVVALSEELKDSMGDRFNGKKVAILDEDVATGNSVRGARTVFSLAYPGAMLVDIGSFTAPKDKYPDFALKPLIVNAGDLWHTLPRVPCGPDTGSIFITPMKKYLMERRQGILKKLDKLSNCEGEEDGKVNLIKRFEIIKESFAEDNTFFNDFLYLHSDELESVKGLDEMLEIQDALSLRSISELEEAISREPEDFDSTGFLLQDYLSELRGYLETEKKVTAYLLNSCPKLQNSWNVAIREAKLLMYSTD